MIVINIVHICIDIFRILYNDIPVTFGQCPSEKNSKLLSTNKVKYYTSK